MIWLIRWYCTHQTSPSAALRYVPLQCCQNMLLCLWFLCKIQSWVWSNECNLGPTQSWLCESLKLELSNHPSWRMIYASQFRFLWQSRIVLNQVNFNIYSGTQLYWIIWCLESDFSLHQSLHLCLFLSGSPATMTVTEVQFQWFEFLLGIFSHCFKVEKCSVKSYEMWMRTEQWKDFHPAG